MTQRPFSRADRLAKSIREVVSDALQYEASDPRLQSVVITRVQVAPDLQTCKVYWHLLSPGSESEIKDVDAALTRARGWLKRQVASQVQVRKLPDIKIYYDRGLQHARHMEALFQDLPTPTNQDEPE